jgi:hypothetical protein
MFSYVLKYCKNSKTFVPCCCNCFWLKGKSFFNSSGFNLLLFYSWEAKDNGIYKQHDVFSYMFECVDVVVHFVM